MKLIRARSVNGVKTFCYVLALAFCAVCISYVFGRLKQSSANRQTLSLNKTDGEKKPQKNPLDNYLNRLAASAETVNGNMVQFPSPEVEFIVGPQVLSGTDPLASWSDKVALRRARYWADRFLAKDYNNKTAVESDDLTVADNHYDLALCLYIEHYRTNDSTLLNLARRVADRWWESRYIRWGSEQVPGPDRPGPLYAARAGLMLRALDGRPEMWGYINQWTRQQFDVYLMNQLANPNLYTDVRDSGYAQLYAVLLAKVLPDSFKLYENGTNQPATGQVNDGAARRAKYLTDAERVAVGYFGRLQQPDGGWRWRLWQAEPGIPGNSFIEQPFMLGIYLEAVVALHRITQNPLVKASLLKQLTKACEHLYRDTYVMKSVRGLNNVPRVTLYFYPREFATDPQSPDRHMTTSQIHAFGYAYHVTRDARFVTWGDEMWDACFGNTSDGWRALLDEPYYPKLYAMERRSAPRYLAWRQGGPSSRTSPLISEQSEQPASKRLISAALSRALTLLESEIGKQQIAELVNQTQEAESVFMAEKNQFSSSASVLEELKAAVSNSRKAFAMVEAGPAFNEDARLRVEWTAARLKRALERIR